MHLSRAIEKVIIQWIQTIRSAIFWLQKHNQVNGQLPGSWPEGVAGAEVDVRQRGRNQEWRRGLQIGWTWNYSRRSLSGVIHNKTLVISDRASLCAVKWGPPVFVVCCDIISPSVRCVLVSCRSSARIKEEGCDWTGNLVTWYTHYTFNM